MKLLKYSELKIMPWKNGQGTSQEIAIQPPNAEFPVDPFLWRLSSATVTGSNAFSLFPQYERLLVVWQGQGLLLNDHVLHPDIPYRFSGNTHIMCKLIKDTVIDVGLIYDPTQIEVSCKKISIEHKTQRTWLQFPKQSVNMLFCSSGFFKADGLHVGTGDTLQVTEPVLDLELDGPTSCFHFSIIKRLKEPTT